MNRSRHASNSQHALAGLAVLVLGSLLAVACSATSAEVPPPEPAVVTEVIEGSEAKRITLSARAAERLGIETVSVIEEQIGDVLQPVVPYAAVVYDAKGDTWAYENVDGLTFVRHPIAVDFIDGDRAVLTSGPAVGQPVVIVGAAELWGVDTGVGGGH
jgi:hypothetical protein